MCQIYLIVLKLDKKTGKSEEMYNGPGYLAWDKCGKVKKNGQRPISLSKLQMIMKSIPNIDRIKLINKF